MPAQLPQDGCTPVCAPGHRRKCKRHHLPCTPPAGAGEPGHQCRQSEPQSQRQEQSAPGVKSSKYIATTLAEENQSHRDT